MEDKIRKILGGRKKKVITGRELTPSAVLLPLFRKDDEINLLFTRRTEEVKDHKGQVSFPGGTQDAEDESLLATALRESFEEIGIKIDDVKILGELDDITTITKYRISPFVGIFSYPYEFVVNEAEIAELIEVPVPALLDPKIFTEERAYIHQGEVYPVYYFNYEGSVIWGATAKIVKQFLELIFGWSAELTES
ncbi:MAG: CoA pyrophosphatase [Deltaproteobacteria bacterium]|nr:MAG: CoA pyrophosphatase [Deltaproteobacteria bacterium]